MWKKVLIAVERGGRKYALVVGEDGRLRLLEAKLGSDEAERMKPWPLGGAGRGGQSKGSDGRVRAF